MLPPPGNARILIFAHLVNTFGNGAYLTTSALFLTRSVGLSPAQVALGLAVAAAVGMALSTPMGYVADHYGAKRIMLGTLLLLAVAYAGLVAVRGVWSFTLLASVIAVGEACAKSANGAMVATAVPPEQRLRLRAYLRSANNAGIGLGALAGSLPLLLDTRAAYVAMLLGNTATFLLAATVLTRVRAAAPVPARPDDQPRLIALRDRPFLSFALVDGLVASLYNEMLSFALPLWLALRAHAPLWLVSATLLINTMGCVLFQVLAARGADGPASGARVGRRGALVVAGSCVLFGLTADLPVWLSCVVVLVAAAVHVLGELFLSTGTWAVIFGLAPDWAQGQYQGAYLTGRQIGNMVTPALLTALVIGGGGPGWLAVGAIFVVAGLAYPRLLGWGIRTRAVAVPAGVVP
ncbi:MFS transporter [Micromonospora sp. URMC 106]|uniref:MFS transporter n=1 Tax=Micromonospora sp. URMC 106 TaxID=3423408 RepID=UPI003F1D6D55